MIKTYNLFHTPPSQCNGGEWNVIAHIAEKLHLKKKISKIFSIKHAVHQLEIHFTKEIVGPVGSVLCVSKYSR